MGVDLFKVSLARPPSLSPLSFFVALFGLSRNEQQTHGVKGTNNNGEFVMNSNEKCPTTETPSNECDMQILSLSLSLILSFLSVVNVLTIFLNGPRLVPR